MLIDDNFLCRFCRGCLKHCRDTKAVPVVPIHALVSYISVPSIMVRLKRYLKALQSIRYVFRHDSRPELWKFAGLKMTPRESTPSKMQFSGSWFCKRCHFRLPRASRYPLKYICAMLSSMSLKILAKPLSYKTTNLTFCFHQSRRTRYLLVLSHFK